MRLNEMDAGRFSCDIGGPFLFGIKKSNEFADELIKLAEEIRSGELIHQSATISNIATQDDYFMTEVKLVFAPRRKASLHGPDSKFPVDVVEKAE